MKPLFGCLQTGITATITSSKRVSWLAFALLRGDCWSGYCVDTLGAWC
jgi:hypothetical protein